MKNQHSKSKHFQIKTKTCYAGVALIALLSTSSFAQAMLVEEDTGRARVHCLWNLGTEAFKASALKILEEKAFKGVPKARIAYLKKLSEFLQEHEDSIYIQDLKILKQYSDDNPPEEGADFSPLSTFYKKTLKVLLTSPALAKDEIDFQLLKLNTFYRRIPQQFTQINAAEFLIDISKAARILQSRHGLSKILYFKIGYLQNFYNKPDLSIEKIEENLQAIAEDASREAVGLQTEFKPLRRLSGKITFKLAQRIPTLGINLKRLASKEFYYRQAASLNYSLARYYLAQLYDTEKFGEMISDYYDADKAYDHYLRAATENALAAHEFAKIRKTGSDVLAIDPNEEEAFKWYQDAAKKGHPLSQYALVDYYRRHGDQVTSLKMLQQSAESGYTAAQLELAQAYEAGEIIEKNPHLAVYWYQKAADQKDLSAYYPLGYAYEKGQKNYEKALHYYSKGRKLNDKRSQLRLGKMYLKAKGTQKSEAVALLCFQEAANQDSTEAQYYLGLMELQGQGYVQPQLERAFPNLKAAADQNHPKALFQYGIMKQLGIIKENTATAKFSYEEAIPYYEEAIKRDNAPALYHLGWLYKNGLLTQEKEPLDSPKLLQQALELWEKAANLGHIGAAYKVGKLYLNMWSHKKDEQSAKTAVQYLKQAAAASHIDAIYLLGVLQERGIGLESNPIEAMKSYNQAAEAGHASAQFKLGKFHEMTLESEDVIEAFDYYNLAAQQGHVEARHALGTLHQTGRGTSKNLDEAFSYFKALDSEITYSVLSSMKQLANGGHKGAIAWFEEKALLGNPHAQKYLGKLLEIGVHLPQNMPEAVKLYQQASQKGNRSAQRRLDDFRDAHLSEVLGIKAVEVSKKTALRKTKALKEVLSKESEALEKSVKTAQNAKETKLPSNPENSVQSGVLSEQDNEKLKAIETQEVFNSLKIASPINAAGKNIEDGHDNIAKHHDELLQDALAVEKSTISSGSQIGPIGSNNDRETQKVIENSTEGVTKNSIQEMLDDSNFDLVEYLEKIAEDEAITKDNSNAPVTLEQSSASSNTQINPTILSHERK